MSMPGAWSEPKSFRFETTHWSVVTLAGKSQSQQSAAALETLCRAYWPPLYAFVRRQGFSEADAEDLTQSFFVHILEHGALNKVDQGKGLFRTFLLSSLVNFLSDQRDRDQALKRGG